MISHLHIAGLPKIEDSMDKERKEHKRISKLLSLVLRHKPERIGIELDRNGWTDTAALIAKINGYGEKIDFKTLEDVVQTNDKKRFSFNKDKSRIRANQGHSITIDLNYSEKEPPEFLYHGTATKSLDSIYKEGLKKQKRHHVHLSFDEKTAVLVGKRHGTPIVLKILAKEMFEQGFVFYESENGVWLTEAVPVKYIRR